MAYVYLIKNYKSSLCIAIGDKRTIQKTFDPTYVGLIFERRGNKNELIYHGGLLELYNFIKNCKKRFFAIPVSMEYPDSGPHFNILIGDNKKKLLKDLNLMEHWLMKKVHEIFDKNFKSFLKQKK